MFLRLGHAITVYVLVCAIGGHWAFLQNVAWTTMLADNLRTDSISEAVQKTFDGKHPCNLCKFVSEGKKSEKKQDLQKVEMKVEKLMPLREELALFTPKFSLICFGALQVPASRAEAPPKPRPKLA